MSSEEISANIDGDDFAIKADEGAAQPPAEKSTISEEPALPADLPESSMAVVMNRIKAAPPTVEDLKQLAAVAGASQKEYVAAVRLLIQYGLSSSGRRNPMPCAMCGAFTWELPDRHIVDLNWKDPIRGEWGETYYLCTDECLAAFHVEEDVRYQQVLASRK